MKVPERQFLTEHAVPGPSPLWIGLFGPSGGGKTFTALELATGVREVTGGTIHMIDTESGRGKHYANLFDYEYTSFPPPHGSLDYLAAIRDAVKKGAKVIIIDSFSHEHEGEGGMIDFQEAEVERMSRGDAGKADSVKMLAWTRPKAARKQLLREMIQVKDVVFILCFRADESAKPGKDAHGKLVVLQLGFVPIAGKPFVYEATVCAFLPPHSNGVPNWNPDNPGERLMCKLPIQFRDLFASNRTLNRQDGRKLAEWARGGAEAPKSAATSSSAPVKSLADRAAALRDALKAAKSVGDLTKTWSSAHKLRGELAASERSILENLELTYEARTEELKETSHA